jgi:hypothetical protein
MADPVVEIEGVGNVEFPSSMSEAEINQAAHKLYTGAAAKGIEANPPAVPDPKSALLPQESPTESGNAMPP